MWNTKQISIQIQWAQLECDKVKLLLKCFQVPNITGEAYKKISCMKEFCAQNHIFIIDKKLRFSKIIHVDWSIVLCKWWAHLKINFSLLQTGVKYSTKYVLWAMKEEANSSNENEELYFQLCWTYGKFCQKQSCCLNLLIYEAAKRLSNIQDIILAQDWWRDL